HDLAPDVDRLAAEEPADERDPFADGACRLHVRDTELAEARDARAEAEEGAAAGDLVQGCDRHGGEGGMARVGGGGAGPEGKRAGGAGGHGQARVGTPGEALVGQASE